MLGSILNRVLLNFSRNFTTCGVFLLSKHSFIHTLLNINCTKPLFCPLQRSFINEHYNPPIFKSVKSLIEFSSMEQCIKGFQRFYAREDVRLVTPCRFYFIIFWTTVTHLFSSLIILFSREKKVNIPKPRSHVTDVLISHVGVIISRSRHWRQITWPLS